MKLPKSIINKIETIRELRLSASSIEQEVYTWFESKGFETNADEFIDTIADKISYGEFENEEQLQEYFKELQDQFRLKI